jgi:hypothetical protein
MSLDLERSVLTALILLPSYLDDSGLREADFPAGQCRNVFSALVRLREEGQPIDAVLLAERIGGNGAGAFIGGLLDGSIRISRDAFLGRVVELKKRSLTARILSKISEQARAGGLNLEEVRGDLEAYDRLEQPAANPTDFLVTGKDIQRLELKVDLVWKLLPARSLVILHSPGGLGKTWFCLQLAKAVSEGSPFLGFPTMQRSVTYVDQENPLAVIKERTCQLDILDVNFWTLAAKVPPPKLDGRDYVLYKKLQPGLLIFDSLRSSFDGDENSSQDIAVVMGRLKELREAGFDVVVIHHTAKASERVYRGSAGISDLADHVLAFHRVRRGSLEEIDDAGDLDPSAPLSLCTAKTRFPPGRLFLSFNPTGEGFSLAEDPQLEALEAIAGYIAGPGCGQNQTDLIEWAKESLGIGRRESLVSLLKRGEREGRWRSHKDGRRRTYEPKTCP